MPETTATVDAPEGPSLILVPVWGPKKDGKPFHAVNLRNPENDERPFLLSQGVLGLLAEASDEELQSLREKAKKARLWYLTHRCVLDKETGAFVVVDRDKALSANGKVPKSYGEAF